MKAAKITILALCLILAGCEKEERADPSVPVDLDAAVALFCSGASKALPRGSHVIVRKGDIRSVTDASSEYVHWKIMQHLTERKGISVYGDDGVDVTQIGAGGGVFTVSVRVEKWEGMPFYRGFFSMDKGGSAAVGTSVLRKDYAVTTGGALGELLGQSERGADPARKANPVSGTINDWSAELAAKEGSPSAAAATETGSAILDNYRGDFSADVNSVLSDESRKGVASEDGFRPVGSVGEIKGKSVASADIFGKGSFATDIDAILSGVGGLKSGGDGGAGRKGVAGSGYGSGYGSGSGGDGGGVDDLLGGLMGGGGGGLELKKRGELKVSSPDFLKGGSLVGKRRRDNIQRVVMQNMAALRYAYNRRLRDKPGLNGKITVKFAVDEEGRVLFAQVVESTMADSELERTVVDRVKSWNFDKIDTPGDVTEVTYPFVFSQ